MIGDSSAALQKYFAVLKKSDTCLDRYPAIDLKEHLHE